MQNYVLIFLMAFFSIILFSIPVVLATTIDSPKKQMMDGISAEDIICNSGLTLMLKSSTGTAACVKPSTALKLQNMGWGTKLKESHMMDDQRNQMIREKEMMEEESNYDPKIVPSDFVSQINNKFFTLVSGTSFIYESQTEDGLERNEVRVTNDTKIVLGVQTVVVWDRVWLDDELIEETFDWYAQDKSGNVWYFGEDSKDYSDGQVISNKGSWEAGVDGAKPGIIMQAVPMIDDSYRQEYYKGVAEDMAQVIGLDESIEVPYGKFDGCLKTKDWNSLEPGTVEYKYYCPEIAAVALEVVEEGMENVELIQVLTVSD